MAEVFSRPLTLTLSPAGGRGDEREKLLAKAVSVEFAARQLFQAGDPRTMIRRLAGFLKSPVVIWVGGVTLMMWILLLWRPNFTEFIELKLTDLKFRFRELGRLLQVVILALDDQSLKKVAAGPGPEPT